MFRINKNGPSIMSIVENFHEQRLFDLFRGVMNCRNLRKIVTGNSELNCSTAKRPDVVNR